MGPKYFTARSISGLAFGADAFYWAEYFFVQFAPYSRLLVSSPIGTPGEVLIEDIPGSVDFVSVQDDGIHVSGEKDWLYSLDGELLETLDPAAPEGEPEPEEEVGSGGAGGTGGAGGASASEEGGAGGAPKDETGSSGAPAEAPRITYSSDGLLLDGELVTEPVHAFSTTGSSVYYIESGDTGVIYRLFFDDPENPDAVADTDYAGAFDKVRVAGDLLGAVILNNDRVTWRVVYGDLSVLER